jgi:D-alanyl-D-alanine carboxypeptidase (penicillin-binding protein 5/6)
VPVKLGVADSVVALPANTDGVLLDKSQKATASCRVALVESVSAPVSLGQRLGTLYLQAGEQVLAEIPLLAKNAVPKLTYGQIFLRLIKQLSMKG